MSNSSEPSPTPISRHQTPRWMPKWMGERERAALILAIGIFLGCLLGAIILSFGIFLALHVSPIDVR